MSRKLPANVVILALVAALAHSDGSHAYSAPSRVAVAVLEKSKHSVLVGEGARDFASAKVWSLEAARLSTSPSLHLSISLNAFNCRSGLNMQGFEPEDVGTAESAAAHASFVAAQNAGTNDPVSRGHDTLGVVVCDSKGRCAACVTTSGMGKLFHLCTASMPASNY